MNTYKPLTKDELISVLTELFEKIPPAPTQKEFVIYTSPEGKAGIDNAIKVEFLKQEIANLFGKKRLPVSERDRYLAMLNSPDPDDLSLVETLIAKRYPSNSFFPTSNGHKVHIIGS